jgi:hypothetical protein
MVSFFSKYYDWERENERCGILALLVYTTEDGMGIGEDT